MKKLKIPIEKLKPYWKEAWAAEGIYRKAIEKIEAKMQKKFKNRHISFFCVDGEMVGIGTYPCVKEMDLIHDTWLNNA